MNKIYKIQKFIEEEGCKIVAFGITKENIYFVEFRDTKVDKGDENGN